MKKIKKLKHNSVHQRLGNKWFTFKEGEVVEDEELAEKLKKHDGVEFEENEPLPDVKPNEPDPGLDIVREEREDYLYSLLKKEQVELLKEHGLDKDEIKELRNEKLRVAKLLELEEL